MIRPPLRKFEAMEHSLSTLPSLVVENVIKFVPPEDLCNLSQASTYLNKLANKPKYWRLMKVRKDKIQEDGLSGYFREGLFSIDKFKNVRRIDLSHMTFSNWELEENLKAIVLSKVEDLDLSWVTEINLVPAELLERTARKLRKISLCHALHNAEQCIALLEACVSSSTLTDVNLIGCFFWQVPVELLSQAIGKLSKVDLDSGLDTLQRLAVYEVMVTSPSLMDVSLGSDMLSEIPPEVVGWAVQHIQKIKLDGYPPQEYCLALFEACNSSSTLRHVNLVYNFIGEIPPDLLGQAVGHLEKVNLYGTDLTTDQSLCILEECISSSMLNDVNLANTNLSEVPAQLLEQAAGHLQKINLDYTGLTTTQCLAVLRACVSSSKLTEVSMKDVAMLEEIPADILAEAAYHANLIRSA